jgi:epoxyqueuosine reductase QueG
MTNSKTSEDFKNHVLSLGADRCGIAPVERFAGAPEGFHPADIFPECRSVVIFLKQMPPAIMLAINPVPYSHAASLLYNQLDLIGLEISIFLHRNEYHAIPIPADRPYLAWNAEKKHGQAILSMRHAGHLAGLGFLGRNTLLIHPELGNMVYIGAVLTDMEMEADPVLTGLACPPNCNICLEVCPVKALDGTTVNQKLCRHYSGYKNERGFDIYGCNACRRKCPLRTGIKTDKAT